MSAQRPGHKQTEVGVIPEDWDVPVLRQQLYQNATYGVVTAGTFQQTGVPMLRGGDIKDGKIGHDQPLITTQKNQEYARTMLKAGDVVIALVGYPGETAVVPSRLYGANISRAVGLLRPSLKLDPNFLACYLNSPNGRREFLRPSAGSAQIVVNLGALNKLPLPLPRLSEQHSIAKTLGDTDELIDALDALIAKKRNVKQGAMQELLTGQRRLAGFQGKWEEKRLEQLGEVFIGLTYSPREITAQGLVVLRSSNVQGGVLNFDDIVRVRSDVANRALVKEDDLLICVRNGSRNMIGKCALIPPHTETMAFGAFMAVFRSAHNRFLFQVFQASEIKKQIDEHLGATINQITNKSLKGFEVNIPNNADEQRAIAAVLSDMDAEIAALEGKLAKVRALKQGMMQVLLTGEVRLI